AEVQQAPSRRSSHLKQRNSSPRLFSSRGSTDSTASYVQIAAAACAGGHGHPLSSSSSSSSGSSSVFSKTPSRRSNVSFANQIFAPSANRPPIVSQSSVGGRTMQAEQGSIGDLQKYHNRYLRNRRHTLANVR
ncbi:Hypothetical predicted protein, partial [Cloeon dipterum]